MDYEQTRPCAGKCCTFLLLHLSCLEQDKRDGSAPGRFLSGFLLQLLCGRKVP